MKASEMIVQLEELIDKHGDLPLAVMEINDRGCSGDVYIEIDGVEGVLSLGRWDRLFDSNDCENLLDREVFLLD